MRKKERSLFSKLVWMLLLLLLPVLILQVYSNRVNERVITGQIKQSSISRISALSSQMDNLLMQLETYSHILIRDPNVIEFQDLSLLNPSYYDRVNKIKIIQDKLYLESASTEWTHDVVVYSPRTGQTISTVHGMSYDPERLQLLNSDNWNFVLPNGEVDEEARLVHLTVEPYQAGGSISKANSIIEVRLNMGNMIRALDQFRAQGIGEALFYKPQEVPLSSSTCPPVLLNEAISALQKTQLSRQGELTLHAEGISYLLTYSHVQTLDGYVAHIIPLSDILTPLRLTNRYSYLILGLLLVVGIAVSWVLYRNVQLPLRALMKGVQQIKKGQYKARIPLQAKNEFRVIISRFNEMAKQIQELIENVLEQQLHAQEAELKQLQSQINPHFLYNSLSYIISMTKLNRQAAVLQMAYHLSDYYRYTTRVQNQTVRLEEELKNAADFLSIHQMRMSRIHYELDVDPGMLALQVPRLILQPLVENALIHGIGDLEGPARIIVKGRRIGTRYSLSVEDNGGFLTPERLQDIQKLLTGGLGERSESCGLQNVHRRIQLRYGGDAGLRLSINNSFGLMAELNWKEGTDGEAADRG